jgi:hypothetical protein
LKAEPQFLRPSKGFEWSKDNRLTPRKGSEPVACNVPRAAFQEVSDLVMDPLAILQVANKYGSLTGITGERLGRWFEEIQRLREPVRLWRLWQRRDRSLKKEFVWKEGELFQVKVAVMFCVDPEGFSEGDVFAPAIASVIESINVNMQRLKVSPRLEISPDGRPTVGADATTLAELIWVQFFEAVSEEREFKPCAWKRCALGGWIDMSEHNSNVTMHPECRSAARQQRYRDKPTS